jgi:hypothetical protein
LFGHHIERWTDPATGETFDICLHCGKEWHPYQPLRPNGW